MIFGFILIIGLVLIVDETTSFAVTSKYSNRSYLKSSQLSMNMMDRFFRVVKSNVNSVLQNLEDPEKVLDQAVNDMQSDLIKVRQSYAEVSATQKRMERQKEQADNLSKDWYRRAQLALEKGDEELAREALSRRQAQVDISDNISKQLSIQVAALEKLYTSMTALDAKIVDAKRQKDMMIARARTAKTTVEVTDMLSGISSGSNSMAAFDRMKEKVESLEAQAEVAGELAASSSGSSLALEDRFRELDSKSKVDDELEMLRRQLPGSQKVVNILPPAGSLDAEYEKLKRELGKS